MKINPITIVSAGYALLSRGKNGSELAEQQAIIADMRPYYDACEKNEVYDAPAVMREKAAQEIKDGIEISYQIRMGFPGEVSHFSISADVTIKNNSQYDMDIVGVLMEPMIGGVQFGDIPGYTLLDWIDLNRLSGRFVGAGQSETITISFRYLKMSKNDRLSLRKIIAEEMGFPGKLTLTSNTKGECPVKSSFELVVKKNRTAFSDARYVTFGLTDFIGTLRWVGANYYPDSLTDQENTIQNSIKEDEYGYSALMAFFDDKPTLSLKYNADGPVQ